MQSYHKNGRLFPASAYKILFIFVPVMFIFSLLLNYNILSNDSCNCNTILSETKVKTKFKPLNFKHKLAVLVPYRERFEELLEFAPYMHNFLKEQQIDHDIFILNQVDGYRFNRASLINVGFLFVEQTHDYIVMHDVDLLPLNKNLSYQYSKQPHHIAAPNLHPRYHYEKFIGGILLINREQFRQVNGLSNRYWGWGLEDDEFYVRLRDAKLNISRPVDISTGSDNTFKHIHGRTRKRDTVKCFNQREVTRKRDRQTGLKDVKYKVKSKKEIVIDGAPVHLINVQLYCNYDATPWCDCNLEKKDGKALKEVLP